jgi:hypothetical protein
MKIGARICKRKRSREQESIPGLLKRLQIRSQVPKVPGSKESLLLRFWIHRELAYLEHL